MNNTLGNGFRVLKFLAESGEAFGVSEIASRLSLPNSHACRLLKTLVETGYVVQKSRKYQISLRVLCLSNARLKNLRLRRVGQPILRRLCGILHLECVLDAWCDSAAIVIASESPRDNLVYDSSLIVGNVHQPVLSACGKVCCAFAESEIPEEIDWSQGTAAACHSKDEFEARLAQIRQDGFARMKAELAENTGSVAAPVFNDDGSLAGAVGIVLPYGESLWTDELWSNCTKRAAEAGHAITLALKQN